jgi:uncharacterized membrane protein YfcA
MKSAGILTAGGLGLWAIFYVPCRLLGGEAAVVQSLAALGLTLLPALATLLWAAWTFRNAPDLQLLAVMGGSIFRMAVALGGAWLLLRTYPETFDKITLLALLALFYVGILGLEVGVIVRQVKKEEKAQ